MNKRDRESWFHTVKALEAHGLTMDECETLRRCSMTLRRWAERECGDGSNWAIERDEKTGRPYNVNHMTGTRYPIADREAGALKRAGALLKSHGLELFHQGDPRGCAIYAIRPGDVPKGEDVGAYYNRGICVA